MSHNQLNDLEFSQTINLIYYIDSIILKSGLVKHEVENNVNAILSLWHNIKTPEEFIIQAHQ